MLCAVNYSNGSYTEKNSLQYNLFKKISQVHNFKYLQLLNWCCSLHDTSQLNFLLVKKKFLHQLNKLSVTVHEEEHSPAVRNINVPSSAGFLEPETGACGYTEMASKCYNLHIHLTIRLKQARNNAYPN